jgi:hypothetical protein
VGQGRRLRRIFLYCRGFYRSRYREAGGSGWNTDYPGADNNFSVRLIELTTVYHIKVDEDLQPNYVVVPLTDPLLFRCPMLFMEDVDTTSYSEEEVKALREFFPKGGFLWVDDYWGSYAWDNWVREVGRVLPPSEYPIFDIALNHPIMHTLYDVNAYLQVSSINFWSRTNREVSERGPEQRAGSLSRHSRQEGPPDGDDDAQHRCGGHLGTRGREPGVF